MAKKSTRVGRDGRPKLNEAQLQAYRARKAATVAVTQPPPTEPNVKRQEQTGHVTAWGHVGDEYNMIRSDLVRLLIITAAMFVIIVVLWFFLS
ncbi:MAG TPA: hypothetical protein VNE17_05550 [Nitrolancea sp.]|nr:hypothetical protein [Nitrolancea sp.]